MALGAEPRKVNAELFFFTYGSLVAQLLKDYETDDEVNAQLEKMGYNIGCRLIEDFLARSGVGRCADFRRAAEVITKLGFKMYLGIQPSVLWDGEQTEFTITIDENPFTDYVELPPDRQSLNYCNIICGVLRGALEMVQMKTEVVFKKDVLRGDDTTEIGVKLIEVIEDGVRQG